MPKPYTPTESAKLFHESDRRIKVCWGPIGSGKSSAAFWEYILLCLESDVPLLGVVVRSTYRELIDTSKETFCYWFGDVSTWDAKNETFTIRLPHGDPEKRAKGEMLDHRLRFRAIQSPEETSKLLSMEIAFAFLEECVPAYSTKGILGQGLSYQVFEMANSRLRQAGAPRYTIVLTANPPSPSHWLYKKFLALRDDALVRMNACVVFQPPGENKKNLPKDYYDILRTSMDPDLVRRFIDGEIIQAYDGMAVFPECRDHIHVVDTELEPVPDRSLILGFDWGSASATATVVTQITASGQWLVLRELISPNMGADAHCEELRALMKEFYPGMQFRSWGDPSGAHRSQTDAKTCFQIAASKGFEIQPGKIDWQSRKEVIKQRLLRNDATGEPAMLISRQGCPVTAEGMLGGYRYPVSTDGRVGHRPIKNNFSHSCFVAGTSISTPTGEVPIESLRLGDLVQTPLGPRAVSALMSSERPETLEVFLSTGVVLRCTPDHPFFTGDGFIPADALQYGTTLAHQGDDQWKTRFRLHRSSNEQSIQFSRFGGYATTGSPLSATINRTMSTGIATYTVWCGKRIMDRFHEVMPSITEMVREVTIGNATWNAYLEPSIAGGTCLPSGALSPAAELSWLRLRRYSGDRSTLSEIARSWRSLGGPVTSSFSPAADDLSAKFVGRSTRDASSWRAIASVAQAASRWLADARASIMSRGSAPRVGAPLPSTATPRRVPVRVLALRPSSGAVVYNLTVADAHAYYAGGVLVSNCDAIQYAGTMEFEILSPRARAEKEIHIWKPVFDPFRPMIRPQIRPQSGSWMGK